VFQYTVHDVNVERDVECEVANVVVVECDVDLLVDFEVANVVVHVVVVVCDVDCDVLYLVVVE
jgi:hypothetical protein